MARYHVPQRQSFDTPQPYGSAIGNAETKVGIALSAFVNLLKGSSFSSSPHSLTWKGSWPQRALKIYGYLKTDDFYQVCC
jgi:hypothetical protein